MEHPAAPLSERVAAARARSVDRREQQRSASRPLLLVALAIVTAAQFAGTPGPGLHGSGLAISVALAVYVAAVASILVGGWPEDDRRGAVLALVIGAAGVVLAGLVPRGAESVAPSVAVLLATVRLPRRLAIRTAVTISVALGVVTALSGGDAAVNTAASLLLCLSLGTLGLFARESRASQDRTELLLAELEDAREAGEAAAAGEERARIARDLHDVLAHSLSGLAIQLEGARRLAARQQVSPELQEILERSRTLVAEGLAEAKAAVGALRDQPAPAGVDGLAGLVEVYRRDFGLDASLVARGPARPVPSPAGDAVYRAAQEALTNAARHAPGSHVAVELAWHPDRLALAVVDHGPAPGAAPLPSGGGRGLVGMKERVAALGGTVAAGPTADGWSVRIEVPV